MPSFTLVIETILYSLVNLMPYLILSLYPFRNSYRFSKVVIKIIVLIIALIQIALGMWAAFFPDTPTFIKSFLSTGIYIIFYFITIKNNIGKLVFTLLMLSNISNLVVIISKCAEGILFPEMALQKYRCTFTLIMIVFQIILLTPIFIYFKKIYVPAIRGGVVQNIWRYMWIIPLTFYTLWCYIIYNSSQTALEIALIPKNAIFLLIVNIGAFIVYNAVILLSAEQQQNLELKTQNHMLELQTLEYGNLTSRLSEARRINHDVRHNVILMNEYLKSKKYKELGELFTQYLNSISDNITLTYCSHYSLNLIITYFSQLAAQDNIDFQCDMRIADKLEMSESDLSVLVGNLLENAVEACRRIKDGERKISLRGKVENENILLITVDNTYYDEPKSIISGGVYLSSKHSGFGIGVESVKNIVCKYNGQYKFETKDGFFMASVMMVIK